MTIYSVFISKGWFPKELPPSFYSEQFARFATSKIGRQSIAAYKPSDNFTECVDYRLALPARSGLTHRLLQIPHPHSYAAMATLVSKNFGRLLKKTSSSLMSKSRPIYRTDQSRALRTLIRPTNLAVERATARSGATHLLKVDVSQFYPSLYTHAVGWAVDAKLRERANWGKVSFLGKKIDQGLMNWQGKSSQGIPVGNDISFLLAEVVLAQVDRALLSKEVHGIRWYDDYEIPCRSRRECEQRLALVTKELSKFKLRLNPLKTQIVDLPAVAGDSWQDELVTRSTKAYSTASGMVSFFDHAFALREIHRDQPVLMYAIGVLFGLSKPASWVRRVAESCISQAIIAEPGCAQKAYALLSYWAINGSKFDASLSARTIETLCMLHQDRGESSDIAWALAFAIQHRVGMTKSTGELLRSTEDDIIALQALHAKALNLLPNFDTKRLERFLKNQSCDGNHWLLLYESVRQKYLPSLSRIVSSNVFANRLLQSDVTFYRNQVPDYAMLIHPGGAPEWLVESWLKDPKNAPRGIAKDMKHMGVHRATTANTIRQLLDKFFPAGPQSPEAPEPYG